MLSFWKYLHWKTFYVFGCISETAAKFSYSYLVKSCHSTSILSSSVFGTCILIKQQAHPILPPKKMLRETLRWELNYSAAVR